MTRPREKSAGTDLDAIALNPYSRGFYEFLREHHPRYAALSAVDHSHHWNPGALKLIISDNLSVSTHEQELTIFFGPAHVHGDDFADALATLAQIENEELVAVEWREEDKILGGSLTHPDELAIPGPMLIFGTPTQIRILSFRGTYDAVREPSWRD